MWNFKRTFQEAFDTGGLLLFGLGCLFLFRQQYYPNVLGPLSFGIISVGALGFVRHLAKDLSSSIESSKYEEILLLLEQRQSEIAANRCMLEELRDACSRFMAMREILEAWQGDPSLREEQAAVLAKILQPRDVATSRESAQETPSDVQLEPLVAGGNPSESVNRASSEDVGETKLDVQPEQTGRSPKTLKEQALQAHSNISTSLQCHATENHQKEESKKQHLEIIDESKQDPENIREKVTEKDMKQEDRVLKDMEKTGYDGVEYKPEEIEKLSKNDVQPEEKEELQSKESDELHPHEETPEDIASKEIQMAKETAERGFLKEIEQAISEI